VQLPRTESGKLAIAIKPICQHLGIADQKQSEKLAECGWSNHNLRVVVAKDGRRRVVTTIDFEALPMWLASIGAAMEITQGCKLFRPNLNGQPPMGLGASRGMPSGALAV
jgi:hypothetical protein